MKISEVGGVDDTKTATADDFYPMFLNAYNHGYLDAGPGLLAMNNLMTVMRGYRYSEKELRAARQRVLDQRKQVNELSTGMLGKYKKAAGADASAADKAGDIQRGNKRFSGIVKATKKQFDNETKKK